MHIRATVFRHTFSCLYIPVRHLPGRPLSYSTAFFQKLQQLRRGFRMGKIPSVMCCQETDRHDNESSDKYRRQSSPLSVDLHTAQCSHEGCTGINMLYEDVGFLPCHHVTHQTAAYTGKHSYKHQQEGIIRISIINSRHHTQGCKDSQAYRSMISIALS